MFSETEILAKHAADVSALKAAKDILAEDGINSETHVADLVAATVDLIPSLPGEVGLVVGLNKRPMAIGVIRAALRRLHAADPLLFEGYCGQPKLYRLMIRAGRGAGDRAHIAAEAHRAGQDAARYLAYVCSKEILAKGGTIPPLRDDDFASALTCHSWVEGSPVRHADGILRRPLIYVPTEAIPFVEPVAPSRRQPTEKKRQARRDQKARLVPRTLAGGTP